MKTVSFALLALLASLPSACHRKADAPDENKARPVKAGNLLIDSKLSREGTPYSFQEDVFLVVTVKNLSDSAAKIPHLPAHPATWILKNAVGGGEDSRPFRPTPAPGLPMTLDVPEVALERNSEHVYRLPIQQYLGDIPPGRYSLRYRLDSNRISFETPWHEFEIGSAQQARYSSSISNPEHAHSHLLAWIDNAVHPPRILLKTTPIRNNRNLPATTRIIASSELQSGPVVSTAYSESASIPPLVAWLAHDSLYIADGDREDSTPVASAGLPEGGHLTLLESLVASKPAAGALGVTGCLMTGDWSEAKVLPFHWDGVGAPRWLPSRNSLSLGHPRPILLPYSGDQSILAWVQKANGRLQIAIQVLHPGKGFTGNTATSDLPIGDSNLVDFMVKAVAEGIYWAVLSTRKGGAGDKYLVHSGSLDPFINRSKLVSSQGWEIHGMENLTFSNLQLDSHGMPWVMGIGPNGAKVQAKEWKKSTSLKTESKTEYGSLFFRRGDLPQALLFNRETGFSIASVTYPDGSNSSPDNVEDNE